MGKYTAFKERIQSLEEIKDIISAMKNLSILEINRVSHFIQNQNSVVATIEASARDLFSFYKNTKSHLHSIPEKKNEEVLIVFGSERGFCGGFNELPARAIMENNGNSAVIAIGRKLNSKLVNYSGDIEMLDGAESLEEIDAVVSHVIRTLVRYPGARWVIIYNEEIDNRLELKTIRPYDLLAQVGHVEYTSPPLINEKPEELLIHILDQYIFALIYSAIFTSYITENRQRLNHMESAESRIDRKLEKYNHILNNLRQEEITEEIEVILLNSGESSEKDFTKDVE